MGEVRGYRSYVLYGRSNTGKTTLLSTWPKPLLLADVNDKGTDSISDVPKIDVYPVRASENMEEMFWYLVQNPGKYKTLGIDTMSQLQQILVSESSKAGDRAGYWGTVTKQQWGDITARMKGWITRFRDLPMEVVFIAQDRAFNVDDDGDSSLLAPEVGPALSPSVANHLNASVHVIGNTFIRHEVTKTKLNGKIKTRRENQFCLRLGPNPVYTTKIRKPRDIVAPDYIVNPTYKDLISVIKGE